MANIAPPELGAEEREFLREIPARLAILRGRLAERVIGQEATARQLLLAFLAGGHALIVGVPGLAKTLMIRSLADLLELGFARIQFTPDLMPSDITGTSILYREEQSGSREFRFRSGPIFTNLLLADEINRTPPKTQAALLEAMEEYQVTVGGRPHRIERPFFVLATENPIEQEGTYPLPVTQLDRFLFQIAIDYPDAETEFDVIATTTSTAPAVLVPVLSRTEVKRLLELPSKVVVGATILERATRLVRATRPDEAEGAPTAKEFLAWGAGPRAVQGILAAARAAAVLAGRAEVAPEDYEEVILPVLRHRILLNYHAEAENTRPDDILGRIRAEIGDAPRSASPTAHSGPAPLKRRLKAILDAFAAPAPALRRPR